MFQKTRIGAVCVLLSENFSGGISATCFHIMNFLTWVTLRVSRLRNLRFETCLKQGTEGKMGSKNKIDPKFVATNLLYKVLKERYFETRII